MKEFYILEEITNRMVLEFVEFLKGAGNNEIEIHINSAGGEIFSALAISNLLKNKNCTVQIEGLCASAATIISSGAKIVKAAENSLIMIHLPFVGLSNYFNSEDLTRVQKSLTAIEDSILTTYINKTQKPREELAALMRQESWLTAPQALELGLIDEITQAVEIKNFKESKQMEENKNEGKEIMAKYKNSVLAVERARCQALMSAKNESSEINALLDVAIKNGAELKDVQAYIDAIKTVQEAKPARNIDELYKLIEDNLKSGAEGVQNSTPEPAANQSDILAKYINENLKELK